MEVGCIVLRTVGSEEAEVVRNFAAEVGVIGCIALRTIGSEEKEGSDCTVVAAVVVVVLRRVRVTTAVGATAVESCKVESVEAVVLRTIAVGEGVAPEEGVVVSTVEVEGAVRHRLEAKEGRAEAKEDQRQVC